MTGVGRPSGPSPATLTSAGPNRLMYACNTRADCANCPTNNTTISGNTSKEKTYPLVCSWLPSCHLRPVQSVRATHAPSVERAAGGCAPQQQRQPDRHCWLGMPQLRSCGAESQWQQPKVRRPTSGWCNGVGCQWPAQRPAQPKQCSWARIRRMTPQVSWTVLVGDGHVHTAGTTHCENWLEQRQRSIGCSGAGQSWVVACKGQLHPCANHGMHVFELCSPNTRLT